MSLTSQDPQYDIYVAFKYVGKIVDLLTKQYADVAIMNMKVMGINSMETDFGKLSITTKPKYVYDDPTYNARFEQYMNKKSEADAMKKSLADIEKRLKQDGKYTVVEKTEFLTLKTK